MATIYQVSKLAGVSLATVSRVLNNNARVSEKTREKVTLAMETLGYRPNSIAQSLASSCANSVGILVSELHGAYFGQMMAGIEAELRAAGKHVIITTGHAELEKEKDGIEFLISRNCDAIIAHVEALSDEYLLELNKGKTPIFLMSRSVEGMEENCVSLDNELGGYLATKAVTEKGHQKIAYIAGPKCKADANDRFKGHQKALVEAGLTFDPYSLYAGDYSEAGGSQGLQYFIDKEFDFTAIVCANDEMASGAMKTARELDFYLPNKLSIIGFDNNSFASYLYPQLTTINNPINQMGHMAARLVLQNVYKNKTLEVARVFKPTLVSRDSLTLPSIT